MAGEGVGISLGWPDPWWRKGVTEEHVRGWNEELKQKVATKPAPPPPSMKHEVKEIVPCQTCGRSGCPGEESASCKSYRRRRFRHLLSARAAGLTPSPAPPIETPRPAWQEALLKRQGMP